MTPLRGILVAALLLSASMSMLTPAIGQGPAPAPPAPSPPPTFGPCDFAPTISVFGAEVRKGGTTNVSVRTFGCEIRSFTAQLAYDPADLLATSVLADPFVSGSINTTNGIVTLNYTANDSLPHEITIGFQSLAGSPAHFGDAVPLNLSLGSVTNATGQPLSVTIVNGTLTLVDPEGFVAFDRERYFGATNGTITMRDRYFNADPAITEVVSNPIFNWLDDGGHILIGVDLTETGPNTSVFVGSFSFGNSTNDTTDTIATGPASLHLYTYWWHFLGETRWSPTLIAFNTTLGNFSVELLPEDAPQTTKHIADLVDAGFYDNMPFHRFVEGFVIQGGDPNCRRDISNTSCGTGGSGSTVPLEANGTHRHIRGAVGLGRTADPHSGDSQLYIVLPEGGAPHLDGNYTVFGQVVAGMDVVDRLRAGDVMVRVRMTSGALELKLGIFVPLSGALLNLGPDMRDAALLAVEEINAAGRGIHVTTTTKDDGTSDTANASSTVNEFVAEGASAIVGPCCSGVTGGILDQVIANGIVLASPSATSPALTLNRSNDGYFFRLAPNDGVEGKATAAMLSTSGIQRAVVVFTNNSYGHALHHAFTSDFGASNVVRSVSYAEAVTNFTSTVSTICAQTADALVVFAYVDEAAGLLQELKRQNCLTKFQIFGTQELLWDPAYDLASRAGCGSGSPPCTSGDWLAAGVRGTTPRARDFSTFDERFHARFGRDPQSYSAESYDAVVYVALAALLANSTQGSEIKTRLLDVANAGLKCTTFAGCAAALQNGTDIDYSGVAHDLEFDANQEPANGLYSEWKVRGNGTTELCLVTCRLGGATFVEATVSPPESLDPAYNYETAGGTVLDHVYERLFDYSGTATDHVEPRLAVAMPNVSEDGRNYTINLRPNVRFHDGSALTATDVKFSLDRIVLMNDPNSPAWIYSSIAGAEEYWAQAPTNASRATYASAGGVTVMDASTVRITLARPDPAFVFKLAFTGASIVSRAYVCTHANATFVDCLPPPGMTRDAWMDTHEMGTGPFKLDSWNFTLVDGLYYDNSELALSRFDDHWGIHPALSRVVLRTVPDTQLRMDMLRNGIAHSAYVPPMNTPEFATTPNVRVAENPSMQVSMIGFNQAYCGGPAAASFTSCMDQYGASAPRGANGVVDTAFFADKEMRQAWVNAFNYSAYLQQGLGGHGQPLKGAIPTGLFGADPDIPDPVQNLTAARAYLNASRHADGFNITVFYNNGNTARQAAAELLKENIESLAPGIYVNVSGVDFTTQMLPQQRALAIPIFFLGWAPDYGFPDNYLTTFGHSTEGVYAKRINYTNQTLDAMLDALTTSTASVEVQRAGWQEAERALNGDAAYLWLAQVGHVHAERKEVQGYYYNPLQNGQPGVGNYSAISLEPGGGLKGTLRVDNATAAPGGNATVAVRLQGVTSFGAATIRLAYDPSLVQVTAFSVGNMPGVSLIGRIDNMNGTLDLSSFTSDEVGPTGDYVYANIAFFIVGEPGRSATIQPTVVSMAHADGAAFKVVTRAGTILMGLAGDVNSDNAVDIVDAMFTAQYANGNRASLPYPQLCDVSHDGQCDIVDAMFIAQYANGNRQEL